LIFLFVAIAVYNTNPFVFIVSYVVSALLDAVDGMAARRLGQSNY
jgi:phosphatidylglycerophosphate synthase